MAQIKKTQTDKSVPKGMVRGERSEGKLYKKADADKWGKGMSDAMDKQAGLGKYAPKKTLVKKANSGVKMKKCKYGCK